MASARNRPCTLPELLLAIALGAAAVPTGAADALLRAEISEPRPYGHTLGDVLQRQVVLETRDSWSLDEKSLPQPGRSGTWLEVLPPRVAAERSGSGTRYTLTLAYQITSSPREVTTLLLPELTLQLRAGDASENYMLPEAPFTAGPLTPETVLARGPLDEMQADIAPSPIATEAIRGRLAVYALAAGALLVWLAWRLWGIPWLARGRGPFARALPQIRKLARQPGDEAARQALRRLHRAFDETAGQALFAEQLPAFLAQRPRFAGLDQPIAQFFELSRATFFGGGAMPEDSLPALVRLCRECRDAERGTA